MLNRKSSFDVDNAIRVIVGVGFAAILLAVLLLVIVIVLGLSVFADNGINTSPITTSIIGMITNFFALMPTVGTILGVVILIAGIVILVLYVVRMKNAGTAGAGGGFQG